MNDTVEIRRQLQQAIAAFEAKPLLEAAENFWNILGYESERKPQKSSYSYDEFVQDFQLNRTLRAERALKEDWEKIHILFQLTDEVISQALKSQSQTYIDGLQFDSVDKSNLKSYLMMAIELRGDGYSRTKLANLTREINRSFMTPVLLLIKTKTKLHLAVIFRRRNKRDDAKDVLEKVTIIKDIDIKSPHRAHINILAMLSLESLYKAHSCDNFDSLHKAWQSTLDISELNKRFYKELSNWFFWALGQVNFPDAERENREERNSIGLIRLLTRLIFVWFMKEKSLVPDELFDVPTIKSIIRCSDANDSSYYKAILQNLFFATLNSEPSADAGAGRRFRSKSDGYYNKDFSVFNVFRYESLFQHPENVIQRYFEPIPFLNGGLFECLDSDERIGGKTVKIYKDGFSDRKDNPIKVPDQLFLLEREIDCDLNDYFGTQKKSYKTKGLLAILHSYKFTIAENTPIEEEVALDPELLGRVFENLLAAYNPETKETARKQTGSFYTPREVVDFMVNEAIIYHLLSSFKDLDKAKAKDMEDRLRLTLHYIDDDDILFESTEVDHLIDAINDTKIIDPACGSGAFPMGLLHKMVYLLHKLDPDNQKWRQRQIDNLIQKYRKEIDSSKDDKEKENLQSRLGEDVILLKKTFDEYGLDYSRKLFLIERCIYGVDIQSIAIQISQLRFFISLLVDQVPDGNKENYGIQSLPNLENNFVAANSLIHLGVQRNVFYDSTIEKFIKDIRDIHFHYFGTHNRQDKNRLRKREAELREKLGRDLREDHGDEVAGMISKWNPYKRDESADFFDSQIMFGVEHFDIVIANPPYIQHKNIDYKQTLKDLSYEVFAGTADLYTYFYELGLKLLKERGTLSFITSNKWLRAPYGEKLRKVLAQDTTLKLLVDFGGYQVFEATVDTNILILQKQNPAKEHLLHYLNIPKDYENEDLDDYVLSNKSEFKQIKLNEKGWSLGDNPTLDLMHKLERKGKPLKGWDIKINRGVTTGSNDAFIIDSSTKDILCERDNNSNDLIKRVLRGKNIRKHSYQWDDEWIICTFPALNLDIDDYPAIKAHLQSFGKKLEQSGEPGSRKRTNNKWFETQDSTAYYEEFDKPKIIYPEIRATSSFSYDESNYYLNNTAYMITGSNLHYILGILNSKVFDFYMDLVSTNLSGAARRGLKVFIKLFPIPPLGKDAASERAVVQKVKSIITMDDTQRNSELYERTLKEIDELVYQLYDLTEEEKALVEGKSSCE